MTTTRLACISAALMIVFALPAQAERADREKPINLEADRISMDDVKKVQIFEGNVILTQGTMQILTNRLVVTQDADGFQKGVATGGANGLARFRQKRDGTGDYIEGEAERIEHNARDEKTEFFTRAWVKSGQDEVRGHYISYDALTENYVVTNGGDTKTATGAPQARVRAIIQPKGKNAPPAEHTGGESSAPKPATPATPKP
jgi:lipopolysaccharide export system protein LptA